MFARISLKSIFASIMKIGRNEVSRSVCALLLIPGLFLLILSAIPIYIFRVIVIIVAKWFRPDLGICMNGITNSFLVHDWLSYKRTPRGTIVVPLTFSGTLTQTEVEQAVSRQWIKSTEIGKNSLECLKYPKFSQYPFQWLGFTFWKNDTNFDVKNHVYFHTPTSLGTSGDGKNGIILDEHVVNLTEKLMNAPYHSERSPWDLHIVQNYKNPQFQDGPMTILILRVHHCLADGYSIMGALVEGLCGTPMKSLNTAKPRYPKRTMSQQIIYTATFSLVGVYELWQIFKCAFTYCPWKIEDKEKEWYMYTAKSGLIPMEIVKKIKNNYGVSFTSVLLAAISRGIARNLEMKKSRMKSSSLKPSHEDTPGSMLCMSTLPYALDSREDRLTNLATGAIFRIPTEFNCKPLDRLKKCDKMLEDTKNSVIPQMTLAFFNVLGELFTNMASVLGRNRFVSIGLTNFPSLPKDSNVCLNGKRNLFAEFTVGGLEGVAGVAFIVISCYPYIRIAASAEKAVLSKEEVNDLIKSLEQEINTMYLSVNTID